ncbi:MAG TPA: hypothetical protein VGI81_23310 [Tepidisphaeraceae bacterium]|jgi:hypothetical protein
MGDAQPKSDKQRVIQLLEQLPDDCTLDDIQYHLGVMQVIQRRGAQADSGDFVSQEDVKARLANWRLQ